MLVGFATQSVHDAAHPQAIGSADAALAITVLARSPNLGLLLTFESLKLTRLSKGRSSDYHLGTPNTGVSFRTVDRLGNPVATDHTKESLMLITAVTILEIGVALAEAKTA